MKDISQTLADAGIKNFSVRDGNQKLKCPQCQPPHNAHDNPLSVTIDGSTVLWKCHHCEWKGGSGSERYFQKPVRYTKPKVPEKPRQDDFVADYFLKRGISKNTLDRYKIYSQYEWICFPYIDTDGETVNVKFRTTDKKFRQSANAKKILYNYNRVHDQNTVIFCEGEIDVLSLAQVGYDNATTLSDGASQSVSTDSNDSRFQGMANSPLAAEKVILFCDNDKAGEALKESILYRVGKDKAWYVDLKKYENCKDANDVLIKYGEAALKDCIENAIPYPVEGLYKASDYVNEITDMYDGKYVKPIEIGIGGLDDIYKIQKGTMSIVTGIPNHGKSLMLQQILLSIAQNHNWRFCIFSPEHSTAMHIRRLLQMYVGKGFDENMYDRMTPQELSEGMKFINNHFFFIETRDATPSIDLILQIARSFVFKYGDAGSGVGLIIDPYNEVDPSRKSGKREDEHIRDFISECKKFARNHNAKVWCVAHPTKMPRDQDGKFPPPDAQSISGSAHWNNMADCILTVFRDYEEKTTEVLMRKVREQDLYGQIGSCKFEYNYKEFKFKPYDISHDW